MSAMVRDPQGPVAQRVRTVGEAQVCTSIIVAAELCYGAERRGSSRLTAQLAAVLGALQVEPFDVPADEAYGRLRTRLEQSGQLIGAHDLLIAAHAIALDCAVLTDNMREFARVDDLVCENWLRDPLS